MWRVYRDWTLQDIAEMKPCLKEITDGRNKMAHGGAGIDLRTCMQVHNCILKLYRKLGFDDRGIVLLKPEPDVFESGCITVDVKGLDAGTEVVRIPLAKVDLVGRGDTQRHLVKLLSG